MNCPSCHKVVPITQTVQPKEDAITCPYCFRVIPSESIVWKDGEFHFNIIGDVKAIKISPRLLLKNQSTKVLDLKKVLQTAKNIISKEPNIRCICNEFAIADNDIRVELITESQ